MTSVAFDGPARGARSRATLGLGLWFVAVSLGWACSDSKPVVDTPDEEGFQMCCELGALCHVADQAGSGQGGMGGATDEDEPSTAQECHWLGHENDPDRCRQYYEHCLDICDVDEEEQDEAVEHACR